MHPATDPIPPTLAPPRFEFCSISVRILEEGRCGAGGIERDHLQSVHTSEGDGASRAVKTAVLIPAHNESAVIAATVRASRSVGPEDPVFVIADRCSDDTAELAQQAGAYVYERTAGPPGKGPALAWFLGAAAADLGEIDAVVILDADSRPRPGAFDSLAHALGSGADAAQAFVHPLPVEGSPAATLAAYSEWLSQAVDDRIRRSLGWPVPLRGTGMMVRLAALRDTAPLLRTRVEDVELTLLLHLRGLRIVFVPEAVVEDPKPADAAAVGRQRARWFQGHREVWNFYGRKILRLIVSRGPATWWLLGALLLKPKSFVVTAKLGALVVMLPFLSSAVVLVIWALAGLSLASNVLYYAAGLALVPLPWRRQVARALLRAPGYLFLLVRAGVMSIRSRESWVRARD